MICKQKICKTNYFDKFYKPKKKLVEKTPLSLPSK